MSERCISLIVSRLSDKKSAVNIAEIGVNWLTN
jgi:hypothetical protein